MEDHADLFPPARPQVRHRRGRLHPGQLCGAHRQGRQCGVRSDRAPALGQSRGARRAQKEVTADGSQDWRRRMKILAKTLAGAALCAAAGMTAAAHHSTTMFDHSRTLTLKGVVLELRWTNPHVTLLVKGTVAEGEEPSEWLLEMTSPGNLVRAGGWSRNAIKAGDEVVVEMSPLRDADKHGGALKKVTLAATGQSYTANLRAQEMPGLE